MCLEAYVPVNRVRLCPVLRLNLAEDTLDLRDLFADGMDLQQIRILALVAGLTNPVIGVIPVVLVPESIDSADVSTARVEGNEFLIRPETQLSMVHVPVSSSLLHAGSVEGVEYVFDHGLQDAAGNFDPWHLAVLLRHAGAEGFAISPAPRLDRLLV